MCYTCALTVFPYLYVHFNVLWYTLLRLCAYSTLQTLVVNLCVIGSLSVSISLLTLCKFVLAQLILPVILVWLVDVSGLTGSIGMHYISEVAHCLFLGLFCCFPSCC